MLRTYKKIKQMDSNSLSTPTDIGGVWSGGLGTTVLKNMVPFGTIWGAKTLSSDDTTMVPKAPSMSPLKDAFKGSTRCHMSTPRVPTEVHLGTHMVPSGSSNSVIKDALDRAASRWEFTR